MPSPFDIPTGPSPFAQEAKPSTKKKKPSYWLEDSWVVCPVSERSSAYGLRAHAMCKQIPFQASRCCMTEKPL